MERGILFSGAMVRALLAGTKTQTRRVVKPPESPLVPTIPIIQACPYGAPGDRLWVRETHAQFSVGEGMDRTVPTCVAYRATCGEDGGFDYVNTRGEVTGLKVTKWTPAIFMPRWASRITLEVTEVRVQRLQDISEEDARAEGMLPAGADPAHYKPARDLFRALWNDINEDRAPWSANHFVWAISFRRLP